MSQDDIDCGPTPCLSCGCIGNCSCGHDPVAGHGCELDIGEDGEACICWCCRTRIAEGKGEDVSHA